jgi:hypothetical protein
LLDSFDLSHRESQGSWPGPLDEAGILDKIGIRALPASSLSAASAFAFLFTLLFLQRNEEMRSLFVLPRAVGLALGILSAALAWMVVVLCSRRPGRLWVRLWALALAVLTSLFVLLLAALSTETWSNALTVAGLAAVLVLLTRLYPLRPNSGLLSRIAPLALVAVLVPVLLFVGWTGHAIAASKRLRVDRTIDQLSRWEADVKSVTSRDWSAANWEDSAQAVDRLGQVQPAGQLDLSLWREASTLRRDGELAAAAGKLLDTTVAGLAKTHVPRVSRLNEPASYYDVDARRWQKSVIFPKASATVGQYFQQLGRIFSELDVQGSFPESQGLADLKKRYLESRARLTEQLRSQMESWTDHWAIFQVPGGNELLGQSGLSLDKLLRTPSPIRKEPAADLPGLLRLSYGGARSLGKPPGCRPLPPYHESSHELYRIDCYSYAPSAKGPGADLRIEMRLVYDSTSHGGLASSDLPEEVYFLFPLPEGVDEGTFKQQVMSDLAGAVQEVTGLETDAGNRGNHPVNGFHLRGVAVHRPRFIPWLDGRKGLEVRAQREL